MERKDSSCVLQFECRPSSFFARSIAAVSLLCSLALRRFLW